MYGDVYEPVLLTDYELVTEFAINAMYPNPFNPTTTISYSVPENVDNLSIDIYDIRGKHIKSLYQGYQEKGMYNISWIAKNYSSGIYFVRVKSDNDILTQKITLLK